MEYIHRTRPFWRPTYYEWLEASCTEDPSIKNVHRWIAFKGDQIASGYSVGGEIVPQCEIDTSRVISSEKFDMIWSLHKWSL